MSRRAAFSIATGSGLVFIATLNLDWSITSASPVPDSVLLGNAKKTGPQGCVEAKAMARRVISGIFSVVSTTQCHFVIG